MRITEHINRHPVNYSFRQRWMLPEGEHTLCLASCTPHPVPSATPGDDILSFRWEFVSMNTGSELGQRYVVWTQLGEHFEDSPLFALLCQMIPSINRERFYKLDLDGLVGREYRAELVHRTSNAGTVYVEHVSLSPLDDMEEDNDGMGFATNFTGDAR